MLDTTEFTHADLPGLVGLTWGGQTFTVFADADKASLAATALQSQVGEDATIKVVARADGKSLVAVIDPIDANFFYADCRA